MKRQLSQSMMRFASVVAMLLTTGPTFAQDAGEAAELSGDVEKPITEKVSERSEKERARLRICTAAKGNNYFQFGELLKNAVGDDFDVRIVETRGSWENLELIDSEPRRCDAIIAQEDAYILYRYVKEKSELTMDRTATLYREDMHLICNQGVKATSLLDLLKTKEQVTVNEYGSGSFITWSLLRRLNPKLKRIKIVEKSIEDAMLSLLDEGLPNCFFFVSGQGPNGPGDTLATANSVFGEQLKLIEVTDPEQARPVGQDKRRVYRESLIPADRYPNLSTKAIPTHSVSAVFFTSPEWKARFPQAAQTLSARLLDLLARQRKAP